MALNMGRNRRWDTIGGMRTETWHTSSGPALLDRSQRRRSPRRPVNIAALIMDKRDGLPLRDCTIVDISQGGAKLRVAGAATLPEFFTLVLSHAARTHRRCQVRWRSVVDVGVQFIPE